MKATGRRAWRKWAKRRRRLYAQLQKSLSVSSKSDPSPYRGVICRRKKKAAEGRGPRAVPVKPFTARSLVGMTMGARKRRARGLVGDDYRIGQRLRPCLGCYRCCPMPCQGCGMLPSLSLDTDCEACRADHYMMAMYACDGSGVLPAKRSAR